MKTKLILVGGFLGAGKTTLLGAAARRLAEQGKAVGLITNDQRPGRSYPERPGANNTRASGGHRQTSFKRSRRERSVS